MLSQAPRAACRLSQRQAARRRQPAHSRRGQAAGARSGAPAWSPARPGAGSAGACPPAPAGQQAWCRRSVCRSLLDDAIEARPPRSPDAALASKELLPTLEADRTFGAADFAALWVTLVISVSTYFLAASLVDLGMSWVQGVATVAAGNLITLVPMILNAHPGTKYGVPTPVLTRASFGIRGSHFPSLSRALVAIGWFGLQTHIGGSSIFCMLQAVTRDALAAPPIPGLAISPPELGCFLAFWLLQLGIIVRGIEAIKQLERLSAPILVALTLGLLAWAVTSAGGFGPMLSAPSQFGPGMPLEGRFWSVFWPAVTANVGFWATLSLNVPDFSRYARSQRAQALGQALGLPTTMTAFSFVGLAVTSATVVIYGAAVRDPVQLLSRMTSPAAVCLALFGLCLATVTTNVAANVVAPANALANLLPGLSFRAAGALTALAALACQPWRLMSGSATFLAWLVGSSALLGPVVGVVLADYHIVRRRQLSIDDLYSASPCGAYFYSRGVNPAALAAVAAGLLPCLPGLLASLGLAPPPGPALAAAFDMAWFTGCGVAAAVYVSLMRLAPRAGGSAAAQGGAAA